MISHVEPLVKSVWNHINFRMAFLGQLLASKVWKYEAHTKFGPIHLGFELPTIWKEHRCQLCFN